MPGLWDGQISAVVHQKKPWLDISTYGINETYITELKIQILIFIFQNLSTNHRSTSLTIYIPIHTLGMLSETQTVGWSIYLSVLKAVLCVGHAQVEPYVPRKCSVVLLRHNQGWVGITRLWLWHHRIACGFLYAYAVTLFCVFNKIFKFIFISRYSKYWVCISFQLCSRYTVYSYVYVIKLFINFVIWFGTIITGFVQALWDWSVVAAFLSLENVLQN